MVTDTIGDPPARLQTAPLSIRPAINPASAEDMPKCDLLLVKMIGPYTSGAVDENYVQETDEEYGMYTPAFLRRVHRPPAPATRPWAAK